MIRTVRFFCVKYTKMLSFFLVAEALTGLICHRPSGENSSFQFSWSDTKISLVLYRYAWLCSSVKIDELSPGQT